MPGFTPTSRRIRFGGIESRRSEGGLEGMGGVSVRGARLRLLGVCVREVVVDNGGEIGMDEQERERVTRDDEMLDLVGEGVAVSATARRRFGLAFTLAVALENTGWDSTAVMFRFRSAVEPRGTTFVNLLEALLSWRY